MVIMDTLVTMITWEIPATQTNLKSLAPFTEVKYNSGDNVRIFMLCIHVLTCSLCHHISTGFCVQKLSEEHDNPEQMLILNDDS
jgi:hypothetical protein